MIKVSYFSQATVKKVEQHRRCQRATFVIVEDRDTFTEKHAIARTPNCTLRLEYLKPSHTVGILHRHHPDKYFHPAIVIFLE